MPAPGMLSAAQSSSPPRGATARIRSGAALHGVSGATAAILCIVELSQGGARGGLDDLEPAVGSVRVIILADLRGQPTWQARARCAGANRRALDPHGREKGVAIPTRQKEFARQPRAPGRQDATDRYGERDQPTKSAVS
jgi:hypothetical protein